PSTPRRAAPGSARTARRRTTGTARERPRRGGGRRAPSEPGRPGSQQALFLLLLAGDAPLRPRHRLQALAVHLVLAHDADAEAMVLDADEGLVDELQQVALRVGQAEEEFLGVRVRRLVGDVLRALLVGLLAVGLVLLVRLQDLLLLLDQLLPEGLQLLVFHVSRRLLFLG